MKQYTDGNTGNNDFVSIKNGIIVTSLSLEEDINSTRIEFELCIIASTLKDIAQRYYDEVRTLKDENARLNKRAKRHQLKPKHPVPAGARFNGYKNYYIQEIEITQQTICYKRERWKTSCGEEILGELPDYLKGNHFGPKLRQFVLYQYFHNHVTQPLLLNQLRELGISISSGQLSNLLTKKNELFTDEKESLLQAGLKTSHYIQVDDTGARHQGKNGYCTQFGNEKFAYFKTTETKSKNSFLTILQGTQPGFRLNQAAYDYLKQIKSFSNWSLSLVEFGLTEEIVYHSKNEWLNYLQCQPYTEGSYRSGNDWLFVTRCLSTRVEHFK